MVIYLKEIKYTLKKEKCEKIEFLEVALILCIDITN